MDADDDLTPFYWNQAGEPMTVEQWAEAFEDFPARRVATTELRLAGEAVTVSTVWIGLDQGFGFYAEPLIFESLVFGGFLDGEGARYATREQAVAGHEALVERVKDATPLLDPHDPEEDRRT